MRSGRPLSGGLTARTPGRRRVAGFRGILLRSETGTVPASVPVAPFERAMRSAFSLGYALLAATLMGPAGTAASPLSTQPEQLPRITPAEAAVLADEQLALRDATPDTGAVFDFTNLASARLRPGESHWLLGDGSDRDVFAGRGRPLQDQLRSIVNVERPERRAGPGSAQSRRHAEDEPLGLEVGASASDWVQDITQSLLHSTLRVDVNERGQTTFSVLGLGEFAVTAAGDRSAITFSAGDDAVFSLHRVPRPEPAAFPGDAGEPGRYGTALPSDLPPLRQMIEAIVEATSHPLSLLVYCIVAGYLLLWALLSQQGHARRRSTAARAQLDDGDAGKVVAEHAGTRRRRRWRATPLARESTTADGELPASGTGRRKRIRVRMRVRVRKPRHSA